jgi:hypothetical protein
MKKLWVVPAFCVALGFGTGAQAAGCLAGAAAGGVAGHFLGHHALAGAAIGCALGHHHAAVRNRMAERRAMDPNAR